MINLVELSLMFTETNLNRCCRTSSLIAKAQWVKEEDQLLLFSCQKSLNQFSYSTYPSST